MNQFAEEINKELIKKLDENIDTLELILCDPKYSNAPYKKDFIARAKNQIINSLNQYAGYKAGIFFGAVSEIINQNCLKKFEDDILNGAGLSGILNISHSRTFTEPIIEYVPEKLRELKKFIFDDQMTHDMRRYINKWKFYNDFFNEKDKE